MNRSSSARASASFWTTTGGAVSSAGYRCSIVTRAAGGTTEQAEDRIEPGVDVRFAGSAASPSDRTVSARSGPRSPKSSAYPRLRCSVLNPGASLPHMLPLAHGLLDHPAREIQGTQEESSGGVGGVRRERGAKHREGERTVREHVIGRQAGRAA